MKRQEAFEHQGRPVVVDYGRSGAYYGILEQTSAAPRKIWEGHVRIQQAHRLPEVAQKEVVHEFNLETIIVPGTKIYAADDRTPASYEHSVVQLLEKEISSPLVPYSDKKEWKRLLHSLSVTFTPEPKEPQEESYIYYEIHRSRGNVFLREVPDGQALDIEDCPFELEISPAGLPWRRAVHYYDMYFRNDHGQIFELQEHDHIRIHSDQFRPFAIFLNELEDPSRYSLVKNIHSNGFNKDDLVECHNHLLYQLMQEPEETSFTGVNFLYFRKQQSVLIVQHHYERNLHADDEDYVFDRFEITTDKGVRNLFIYTNSFARGQ